MAETHGSKRKRSETVSSSSSDYSLESSTSTVSMPPAPDGGYGWVIILSSFMIMLISDGFAFSFGVLYAELISVFKESKSLTSWVPSLFYGIPLICGPISSALSTKYGCRKVQIFGGFLAFTGVFASTFADSIPMLCVTLGVIAGFGMSMGYVTSVVMVAFYFERKRALATGLSVCGSGIGTFVFAPLIEYLIKMYTWKGAFLILSGITLNLVVCGALFRPLNFTPQEQWRRKLEAFEKLSKTVSRSISKSSLNELPRSRHHSNTDDLEEEDEHVNPVEHYSYSQVQLPTFIREYGNGTPDQLFVEIDKSGTHWQHVLKPQRNKDSTPKAVVSNTVVCYEDSQSPSKTKYSPTKANTSSAAYVIWQRQQQKKKRHVMQYYPIYRKDVFYRGNLMKLPQFQVKSTSCPELYLGALDDGDESSDDEGFCEMPTLLRFSKHVKKMFKTMFDLAILKCPVFLVFLLSNFILYFWYDVPYVFIVDNAREVGILESDASFIVSVLGIVNTLGQILYGIIGDKNVNLPLLYGLSTGLAGLSIFLVPLFHDYLSMCVLAGLFGFFISANYSLSTVILVEFLGIDKLTNAYGITMMIQGIANLIGPPVAGKLYDLSGAYDNTFYVGGVFIVLSGSLLVLVSCERSLKNWAKMKKRRRCQEKSVLESEGTCMLEKRLNKKGKSVSCAEELVVATEIETNV